MTGVIRWEEPPTPTSAGRPRGQISGEEWREAANELRANPGEWGVIEEGERRRVENTALCIRYGRQPVWSPSGAFEAASRKVKDKHVLYARFVGEPDPGTSS